MKAHGAAAVLLTTFFLCGCPGPISVTPKATEAPASQSTRPEIIILISIDTLRADHLGLYGHGRPTSPILDAFAANGSVFEDASSTAPWTLPAHASMLTGLYPRSHRVLTFNTALPSEIPTLAGLLAEAGYRTAAVVNSAWLKKERYGLTRDFQKYLFVDDVQTRRAPNTWITDQAIEWLREPDSRPLFLFIHYYDVHSDYASLPQYENIFVSPYTGEADGTGWQLARASLEDDYIKMCHENYDPKKCRIGTEENYLAIDRSVGKLHFDEDSIRHIEELYDAGIRQLDNELGRFFSLLKENRILDDALVILTSDHGEEFLDHGRMDHFLTMYQEVLRVPLIFHGPNIPSGLRITTPVSLVDLMPTILSLSGVPPRTSSDGLDLTPLMAGKDPQQFTTRPIFGEASGGLTYALMMEDIFPVYRSLRRGQHKLIHDSKREIWELYDLANDPSETMNIAEREPELLAKLIEEMLKRYSEFNPEPSAADHVELSREELENLRALGYVP